MTVSSATSSSSSTASSSTTATNPSSTLNQQDFLQLLVAQIQYQDPMNPQSNTDMAAQLAQYTSLQQNTQTAASLAMIQANSLVGDTVNLQVDSNTTASGVVTGVVMNNGTPQITVDGTNYALSDVTSITPPSYSSSSNSTSSNSSTPVSAAATTPSDASSANSSNVNASNASSSANN